MINYYNRKSNVEALPAIDFEDWQGRIATKGLVEKVKANFESLKAEQYEVEKVASQLASEQSEDLNAINQELAFHT